MSNRDDIEMICLDCNYEADCWDMSYSEKRGYFCYKCESSNVVFKVKLILED